MAIVLLIIMILFGMITQGSQKEKGCAGIIIGSFIFMYFLYSAGLRGEEGIYVILVLIGICAIGYFIHSISGKKNNINTDYNIRMDRIDEENLDKKNYIQISVASNKIEQNKDMIVHDISLKNNINTDCNTRMDRTDEENLHKKENVYISEASDKHESHKDMMVHDISPKNHDVKIDGKVYSNVILFAKEVQESCDINKIIDIYIKNRSESQIYNPAEMGLLRGYLVRNTTLNNNKYLSSSDVRCLIDKKMSQISASNINQEIDENIADSINHQEQNKSYLDKEIIERNLESDNNLSLTNGKNSILPTSEKFYDKKIKEMENEFNLSSSIHEILEIYKRNRSDRQRYNPVELSLLRGYLVRNTDCNKKKLTSNHVRRLVEDNCLSDNKIENEDLLIIKPVSKNKIDIDVENLEAGQEIVNSDQVLPKVQMYETNIEECKSDKTFTYKPIKINLDNFANRTLVEKNNKAIMPTDDKYLEIKNRKMFDFESDVHEYIQKINFGEREKLHYIEPNTNITRFKKEMLDYATKLHKLTQKDEKFEEHNNKLERLLQEKISGDLRAIDKLSLVPLSSGYSTWITRISMGELYYPVSSAYVNVLFHQIVNRLTIKNADWALVVMADLWNYYYPNFQHEEVLMWIQDFWVIYCKDISYEEFKKLFKYEIEYEGDNILEAIDAIDTSYLENEQYLDFFNENCDYKIKKGRTVLDGFGKLLEECLKMTVLHLQEIFKNHELKLEDYYHIKEYVDIEKRRDPFRRLIIMSETEDFIVKELTERRVGEYEIYTTELDDNLRMLIIKKRYTYAKSRLFIETIGKICELFLRDWLGIQAKFILEIKQICRNIPELSVFETENGNEIVNAIQSVVKNICISNGIPASEHMKSDINYLRNTVSNNTDSKKKKERFKIDISKLDKIRNDSEAIQEILIDEDDNENRNNEISPLENQIVLETLSDHLLDNFDNEWLELKNKFINSEMEALKIILKKSMKDLYELSTKDGILIEVLIEGINNKALETIGDNLIEFSEEQPIIYDEYIDEVRNMIQGE